MVIATYYPVPDSQVISQEQSTWLGKSNKIVASPIKGLSAMFNTISMPPQPPDVPMPSLRNVVISFPLRGTLMFTVSK